MVFELIPSPILIIFFYRGYQRDCRTLGVDVRLFGNQERGISVIHFLSDSEQTRLSNHIQSATYRIAIGKAI